jgi:inosose dehydratase
LRISYDQNPSAPGSWRVLEFDLDGEASGCAQVLDEMKATRYHGPELGDWGFMPTEAAALKKEIQANYRWVSRGRLWGEKA